MNDENSSNEDINSLYNNEFDFCEEKNYNSDEEIIIKRKKYSYIEDKKIKKWA